MADFDIAFQITLDHEGGYQDHPNDTGNYNSLGQLVGTNYGINARVYESWIGFPPSANLMRQMPLSEAKKIYRRRFWDKVRGDQIKSQPVANIIYDGAVNHGKGIRLLQRMLGLTEDGIFGPKTLAAVNDADPASIYNGYKQVRIAYYHWLAKNLDGASVFLKGWLRRINDFTAFSDKNSVVNQDGQTSRSTLLISLLISGIIAAVTRK